MRNLDQILNLAAENETIQLGPGIYVTNGAKPKAGQKLIGRGRDVTVIELVPDKAREMSVIHGLFGGNRLEHLDLDGGATTPLESWSAFKTNGAFLEKGDNHIVDVGVRRIFGNYATQQECFGLMCHGLTGESSITYCTVNEVMGTYVSGQCIGGKGEIAYWKTIFPELKAEPGKTTFWMGANVGPGDGAKVIGGICLNATSGFYSDWDGVDGVEVTKNLFVNCVHGVLIKRQFIEGSVPAGFCNATFEDNTILLDPTEPEQVCGFLLDNTRAGSGSAPTTANYIRDVRIVSNEIGWPDGVEGKAKYKYVTNIASLCAAPTESAGIQRIAFKDNKVPSDWKWRNMAGNAKSVSCVRMREVVDSVQWVTQ